MLINISMRSYCACFTGDSHSPFRYSGYILQIQGIKIIRIEMLYLSQNESHLPLFFVPITSLHFRSKKRNVRRKKTKNVDRQQKNYGDLESKFLQMLSQSILGSLTDNITYLFHGTCHAWCIIGKLCREGEVPFHSSD